MQLHVFTTCTDVKPVVRALEASRIEAVLYHDLNDPRGIGVLAMEEDPGLVVNDLRALLNAEPFAELPHRTEFTMFGRTYASGFEPDLEDWLLRHPRRLVLDPARPWAVWYPLRRRGAFARLSTEEQRAIVQEHAALGRAYEEADLAPSSSRRCAGPPRLRSTWSAWVRFLSAAWRGRAPPGTVVRDDCTSGRLDAPGVPRGRVRRSIRGIAFGVALAIAGVARASEGVYEEGFAQGRPTAGDAPDNDGRVGRLSNAELGGFASLADALPAAVPGRRSRGLDPCLSDRD